MTRTIVLFAACLGCSDPHPADYEVRSGRPRELAPDTTPAELAEAVAGNRAFAIDLYRSAAAEGTNLVLSPHSLTIALAMTWAGSRGATADQLATAMHVTLPPERFHAALNVLDLELAQRATAEPDPPYDEQPIPFRLELANSLWGQDGVTWHDTFLDTLAIHYGAGLNVDDFVRAPAAAREAINGWIEARTNGLIPELFAPSAITNDTRLVLANAIYFSASWDKKFEAAETTLRPFFVGGTAVDVPMLHDRGEHFRYAAGADYRAVELPYDGGQLAMLVIEPDDLAAFEAALTADGLQAIVAALDRYDVDLRLPKFRIDAPIDVVPHLQALGVVDAFQPAADFSAMTDDMPLAIRRVEHRGVISVDEDGTTAAAASGAVLVPISQPESVVLDVDRPFLFAIRDRPTGAILFLGRVVDPRQE